jgi:hypothetical protein
MTMDYGIGDDFGVDFGNRNGVEFRIVTYDVGDDIGFRICLT